MEKNIVITGANRGIGLAFAKLYLQRKGNVYALCRHPSTELSALQEKAASNVKVISGIDVTQDDCSDRIQQALKGIEVSLLINNAGILKNETLGNMDYQSLRDQFETNSIGPIRITEAVIPFLSANAKIAMITSRMGSITDNTSGGRYGYRMSKAALNIASVSIAHDVKARGIAVAILHPGLVGTDMIGGSGDLTPEQAAERLIQRIDALTLENSGTFWHSNGEILPW